MAFLSLGIYHQNGWHMSKEIQKQSILKSYQDLSNISRGLLGVREQMSLSLTSCQAIVAPWNYLDLHLLLRDFRTNETCVGFFSWEGSIGFCSRICNCLFTSLRPGLPSPTLYCLLSAFPHTPPTLKRLTTSQYPPASSDAEAQHQCYRYSATLKSLTAFL